MPPQVKSYLTDSTQISSLRGKPDGVWSSPHFYPVMTSWIRGLLSADHKHILEWCPDTSVFYLTSNCDPLNLLSPVPTGNISHYFLLQTWVVSSYPALACPNTRAVKTGSLAGKPFVFIIETISVACLMSPLSQTHANSRWYVVSFGSTPRILSMNFVADITWPFST